MAKRKSASRFYVQRADREHIWTVSVFDTDVFSGPDLLTLAVLNGSQWTRQNAGLERATLMRTVGFVNTIFLYAGADTSVGPPDVSWVLYNTDEDDTNANPVVAAGLFSEDVLRFGIANHAVRFAATNSVNIAECTPTISIDSKSKRKLTTDSQVRLAMEFPSNSQGHYRAIFRCLVKLA